MKRILSVLLLFLVAVSFGVVAEDQLQASSSNLDGTVVSVKGSRIEIELSSGEKVTVTINRPAYQDLIGKHVSGEVVVAGDTYLMMDPVFAEQ